MFFRIVIFLFFIKLLTIFCRKKSYSKVCLVDKTVLIVGGSSGIGLGAAVNLATRGARLIIASNEDCTDAKNEIIQKTNIDAEKIVTKYVDFASFKSVRAFAKDILENEQKIDVFISNVGILTSSIITTEDGFPYLMQVNYLSHFLLTFLLLDLLKRSSPSRIIYTSSIIAFASYNLEPKHLKDMQQRPYNLISDILLSPYSDSKLCLAILGHLLAKELEGTGVSVYSHYPGLVHTNIFQNAYQDNFSMILYVSSIRSSYFLVPYIYKIIAKLFGSDTDNGSQTMVTLATANNLEKDSGMYFWYHRPITMPFKAWNAEYCRTIYTYTKELLTITH